MIDAHHHIWRQRDLPWLIGPEQPRIFGRYRSIRCDYSIENYLDDIRETGIAKSVYVQANWATEQYETEVAWVHSIADKHGWPHAVVGYADFTQNDVRHQLDRLASYPLMRGIRQQLHWHEIPEYRFAARPDLASDTSVQQNIAKLAEYGWSFDLQVFVDQFKHALQLIESCPDVTFILEHAGMLEDLSPTGRDKWKRGMEQLSQCENIVTKLSAFGTFLRNNDKNFVHEMIRDTVEIFGAERCMFGSNFPIEKIWIDFKTLFETFQSGAANCSEHEQHMIFEGTAEKIYKL